MLFIKILLRLIYIDKRQTLIIKHKDLMKLQHVKGKCDPFMILLCDSKYLIAIYILEINIILQNKTNVILDNLKHLIHIRFSRHRNYLLRLQERV